MLFTDWQGDADERLTDEPGSEVVEVLGRADERGVDVRGLVWRSHLDLTGFFAAENRHLGEQLQRRGAEVLLDMRVRTGRLPPPEVRRDPPPRRPDAATSPSSAASTSRHNRRDDADHGGDPQPQPLTEEYGEHPPWHDVQVEIRGPAVHDVETVFRERWEDPTPLVAEPAAQARRPAGDATTRRRTRCRSSGRHRPEAGPHVVQLLRTYPDLRHGRDYPFARGGERSVARGYTKAIARAERIVYVEDQYFWGHDVAEPFEASAARPIPSSGVVVVIPLVPDIDGLNRVPQYLGRERAIERLMQVAPGRVAAYGIENHAGTPVYVHAKVCVIDDVWASIGSDNFNRRSWTHDSELTRGRPGRGLRPRPAADPGRRAPRPARRGGAATGCTRRWPTAVDPAGMFDAYAASRRRGSRRGTTADEWGSGRRVVCGRSRCPRCRASPGCGRRSRSTSSTTPTADPARSAARRSTERILQVAGDRPQGQRPHRRAS